MLAGIAEHLTNAEIADRLLADGPERARGEDELTAMGATPTALG